MFSNRWVRVVFSLVTDLAAALMAVAKAPMVVTVATVAVGLLGQLGFHGTSADYDQNPTVLK